MDGRNGQPIATQTHDGSCNGGAIQKNVGSETPPMMGKFPSLTINSTKGSSMSTKQATVTPCDTAAAVAHSTPIQVQRDVSGAPLVTIGL